MPINIPTQQRLFRWTPACWLRVTGDDAPTFLQGQLTNDLRALEQARAVYGLWLNVKGKVVADSFVLRDSETGGFWLGSYFSAAATVRQRLESHVIADDVTIEDLTSEWAGVSLLGAGEKDVRGPDPASLVFPGRRERPANLECMYRRANGAPAWIAAAQATDVDETEITRRRISAGIPAIPIDLGPTDLPNEAGLETEAISYTKGCYLGQEVMARLKSMGQVRRRLWRVRGWNESWPVLPAAVFSGPRQVGELRSAARDGDAEWIGLAMVSLLHCGPDSELSFAADGAPALRLDETP